MTAAEPAEALREALRREGLDSVEAAFAYDGGQDLGKPGLGHRRRTRLALADGDGRTHVLYLKRYGPQGVATAIGRWLRHGRRGSPAAIEYANIIAARAAGVPTMLAVDYGQEQCPIGAKRSYVVVSAVPGEAMERCLEAFLARHADDGQVEVLTRKLARLVRALHEAGYVHRDLYASHVFMEESAGGAEPYLIDLARMFAPRWRPLRWRVKDLAQLKHSMPPAWVKGFWRLFLAEYLPDSGALGRQGLDRAVDRKVASMRRREERRRRRRTQEARP